MDILNFPIWNAEIKFDIIPHTYNDNTGPYKNSMTFPWPLDTLIWLKSIHYFQSTGSEKGVGCMYVRMYVTTALNEYNKSPVPLAGDIKEYIRIDQT